MMTIFLGETLRMSANFKDNFGTEKDPDSGTVKVSLYSPINVLVVTTQDGVKRAATTSTYDYWTDLPSTGDNAVAGWWVQVWIATTTAGGREYDTVESRQFKIEEPTSP